MAGEPVEHAERWMRRARQDLTVIESLEASYLTGRQALPTDAAVAVYLLQQFTEKTVKAFLVADGVDPDTEGRSFRTHASLNLHLRLVRRAVDQPGVRDSLADFDAAGTVGSTSIGNLIEQLESLEELTKSRSAVRYIDVDSGQLTSAQVWNRLQGLDSDQVSALLDAVEEVRQFGKRMVESLGGAAIRVEIPDSLIASDDPIGEFLRLEPSVEFQPQFILTEPQRSAIAEIVRATMSDGDIQDFRRLIARSGGVLEFPVSKISRTFQELTASFAVFALAAITFPHNDSSRYPAPSGGPDDPIEGALAGQLGTEHYRPPLGIVVHLKRLIEEARQVASTFGENSFRD